MESGIEACSEWSVPAGALFSRPQIQWLTLGY